MHEVPSARRSVGPGTIIAVAIDAGETVLRSIKFGGTCSRGSCMIVAGEGGASSAIIMLPRVQAEKWTHHGRASQSFCKCKRRRRATLNVSHSGGQGTMPHTTHRCCCERLQTPLAGLAQQPAALPELSCNASRAKDRHFHANRDHPVCSRAINLTHQATPPPLQQYTISSSPCEMSST